MDAIQIVAGLVLLYFGAEWLVVGSNIVNVVLILGASGLAGTVRAPLSTLALDLLALGILTGIFCLVAATRPRVSRLAGVLLLLGYVTFLISLVAT